MRHLITHFRHGTVLAVVLTANLLAWPALAAAGPSGEAAAVKANVAGVYSLLGLITPSINTSLADTGSLTGSGDMREASMLTGSIPSLVGAEVLHATTANAPDETISQASLSNLGLNIGGNSIDAALVMAEATAVVGSSATGVSQIEGLQVNGVPVVVTGAANQTIPLLGGRIVINEQQVTSTGSVVVNALHIVINGVADIVIASASAGI